MRAFLTLFVVVAIQAVGRAENIAAQEPITMEQLMRALDIIGGNWTFNFDEPVYAKIVCSVSAFPNGEKPSVEEFVSDRPKSKIELFFAVTAHRVGEWPQPDVVFEKKMHIRMSDCQATEGTRLVHFVDKFSLKPWVGMRDGKALGEYRPSVARNPVVGKEYVLYYYFKEGDPYEVKATICFLRSPDDAARVEKFKLGTPRTFETANEPR